MKPTLNKVTTTAPGKLMLTGSYAVVHGYPAVVTAVDQRLKVTVEKNGVSVFHLEAPDLGLKAYSKTIDELGKKDLPKAVRFIELLYKSFLEKYPQDRGIIVTTKSEFSSQFGFGSSSAVTVAFALALTKLYEIKMTNQELFEMCYQTVLKVQGVGSGFDLASAIWGRTIYYVSPAKVVDKLSVKKLPLVVGYTGVKADTPTLIRMINRKLEINPEKTQLLMKEIGQISDNLRAALEAGDLEKVGQQLTAHQDQVKKLGVSSKELDNLISASLSAGAYGATLSGAGGGDCMIAVVDEDKREQVESAITQAGGEVIKVNLSEEGVRVENE